MIQTVSLTEKATLLSEKLNKYVFRVNPRANKIQIKQAIERLFQKKVVDVNTCNYAGKKKRERGPLGRRALEKGDRDFEGRREDRSRLSRNNEARMTKDEGMRSPNFRHFYYGTEKFSPTYPDAALQVASGF